VNYGFHLATGGALAAIRRMDVIANNLANSGTAGFKPDFVLARERPPERLEGLSRLTDPLAPPQAILEKLGGGVRFDRDRIDLRQGLLESTGNDTDLALRGDGFFVLAPTDAARASGKAPIEVTRAGDLFIDSDGTFRSANDGRAFLGETGRPIRIDPTAEFQVDREGRVMQEGAEVDRFRVVRAKDPLSLEKLGGSVLRVNGATERVPDGQYAVLQRTLEKSGAEPVVAMVDLTRQSRLMEGNLRMIQYQDNLNSQAISGIARVA